MPHWRWLHTCRRDDWDNGHLPRHHREALEIATRQHDVMCFFFFQAEDGIRDVAVTGVQTCALPIFRFDPRLWICSATRAWAPAPTPTIAMTAATPMMMPSIVSALRSLLTRSARMAMRTLCQTLTRRPPPPVARPRPARRRAALPRARRG